jgi:predicted ester cyclase
MRVTTVHGDANGIDDVVALVEGRARPLVEGMADAGGVSVFIDREGGRLVATTSWATEQARSDSNAELAPLRAEAARLMNGTVRTFDYEIAVTEEVVPPTPGCWMRSTVIAGDPGSVRAGIADFQATAIPGVRHLDGFCGASLIVDRATGTAVGSTMWSSRAALMASRAAAGGLRAHVATATGAHVVAVDEYEVALAASPPPRYEHLLRRAYELMSAGDLDELDELVAEELVEHAPVPPGYPAGREGLRAFVTEYRQAFPDLRMTLEKYLEQGELACAVVRITGTNEGPLMGRPATGRRIDTTMVDVARIVDGRAVEHWGASDDLGILTQLGIVTLPDAAIPAQASTIDLVPKVEA